MNIPEQNRVSTLPFTCWDGAFTAAELDRLEAYGDGLTGAKATLSAATPEGQVAERIRITQTAFIQQNPETKWLFERMQGMVQALNARSYRFDLSGFYEDFQYTVYRDTEGGHYDWHVDQGALRVQRKLSVSVQLSAGDSYDGCDLQFRPGPTSKLHRVGVGVLIAFPSYMLHRVTPVTRGVRKSLVVWVAGPNFR